MRRWLTGLLLAGLAAQVAWGQEAEPARQPKKTSVPGQATTSKARKNAVKPIPTDRGKIFVKENTWDFGYVAQNTKVTHEFILENVGDDTLFLERIKPT